EGSTATDLVLTVTNMLREHGVVGRFVEFYGPGVANVPLENRATIGNMSPEYGSTVTIFPIDDETLRYLRFTGRPDDLVALVEASIAAPSRPQDRVPLRDAKRCFATALVDSLPEEATGGGGTQVAIGGYDLESAMSFPASDPPSATLDGAADALGDGDPATAG